MNRREFMQALRDALCDIPPEEREAALQYYNDYLDDAGPGNEQQVIREWGSPQELAHSIKSGMYGKMESGEFTEKGFSTGEQKQCPAENGQRAQGERADASGPKKRTCRRINGWKWIAIALLCILLAPICVPLAAALLAVVVTVLAGTAAVAAALFFAGLALFVAGIAIAILGVILVVSTPPGAAVVFGSGLILTAIGAAITLLFGWLSVRCVIGVFRWFVELCRKPFHRRRKAGV